MNYPNPVFESRKNVLTRMRLRSLYLQLPLYMSYNLLLMSSSRTPYYRHEANMCDSLHLMKFILESSLAFCHYFSQFLVVFQMTCSECYCKGTVWSSLDNLVWVSIIQLALRSSEFVIHSSLPSHSHRHSDTIQPYQIWQLLVS